MKADHLVGPKVAQMAVLLDVATVGRMVELKAVQTAVKKEHEKVDSMVALKGNLRVELKVVLLAHLLVALMAVNSAVWKAVARVQRWAVLKVGEMVGK